MGVEVRHLFLIVSFWGAKALSLLYCCCVHFHLHFSIFVQTWFFVHLSVCEDDFRS